MYFTVFIISFITVTGRVKFHSNIDVSIKQKQLKINKTHKHRYSRIVYKTQFLLI